MQKSMNISSLSKGQDFGLMGSGILEVTQESFEWVIGMDTNGTNELLDWFKEQDWDIIMSKNNSLLYLLSLISSSENTFNNSGSTYMEVKIFKNRIETVNIGDSSIMILNKEKIIYKSTPHNIFNLSEQKRLPEGTIKMKETYNNPTIISSTKITNGKGMNYYFKKNDSYIITKSTQLLGHNGITGIQPEYKILFLMNDTPLRIILATDGFTDMINFSGESREEDLHKLINSSCDELTELTVNRWKQTWKYYYDELNPDTFIMYNLSQQKIPCNDDVLVCVVDIP